MRKIGIIIILVLCLTLLLLNGCMINTVTPEISMGGNSGNQPIEETVIVATEEPTEEPVGEPVIIDTEDPGTENLQKWSGLTGFTTWAGYAPGAADIWLSNGFTETRDLRNYLDTTAVAASKVAVIAANTKGLKFIWGVGSQHITASNWSAFRQAILEAAQWAQDNGVFEFQIGNEEEWHVDETTMTVAQIITNLKSLATDVQEIFTNGNVSYSCGRSFISNWVAAGKGDIDILASNIYMGGVNGDIDWQSEIDALVNAFGVDGTYITEFAPDYTSLDHYSEDEAVQAAGVTEMIEYIKDSGIARALFYSWIDDDFGVIREDDGTYRKIWDQALLNSEPVKFATVPTKTTTASLLGTIALMPKITR